MKDYIHYLQNVLGMTAVMLPEQANAQKIPATFFNELGIFAPKEKAHVELLILNIITQSKESLFRPEVFELYEKMRTAMRVQNLQMKELDCTIENRSLLPSEVSKYCEAKVVVVFSSFPQNIGEFVFKGTGRWIETYSPAYLLEDAGAKKVVWNDLQKVMKEFSL